MLHSATILLSDHFEKFISDEVSSGRYDSASEVIRSALRLLENEEAKKQRLVDALCDGEKSGFVKDFDPHENLRKLNRSIT